jgi:carbon monoxide dehydrogenase subunit G
MKLEGNYLFDATVPEVWSALFDPVILAAVMPGCEKLELVDGQYVGEIKVKVGPIQGKFTGKVDLKDKDEPHSYTMVVDGRGAPGFVKATAAVKLAAEGGGTRVHYDTDAQIGGKIASVGQRLIEASARAIVAQSLEGLHTNIKLRAAAHREAAATQAPENQTADAAPVATMAEAPVVNAQVTDVVIAEPEAKPAEPAAKPAEPEAKVAEPEAKPPEPAATVAKPAEQAAAPAAKPAAVAFTPVKVKQSALANAVAKEVASSMFPRSVLVAIILIEALVIVWLWLRH